MVKLYFDLEFTGLVKNTDIISIGIVSETGESFYAEFTDYDPDKVSEWVKENVIDNLVLTDRLENTISASLKLRKTTVKGTKEFVKDSLLRWLQKWELVEIYGDLLTYDWVLFCDLFGGALEIPKSVYYIPVDLCTHMKDYGIDPDVNREEFVRSGNYSPKDVRKHNSLYDAFIIKRCFEIINSKIKDGEVCSRSLYDRDF
jgi:hypothetical protein